MRKPAPQFAPSLAAAHASVDLTGAAAAVERLIRVPLDDHAFAALVSFTADVGAGAFATSALRRTLNAGRPEAVGAQLMRWVLAESQVVPALVVRRAWQAALYHGLPLAEASPAAAHPFCTPVDVGGAPGLYLRASADLSRGAVDDVGDARYLRPSQNVPDGYVVALQSDLVALGFDELGPLDGTYGVRTRSAVLAFQRRAGLADSGVVDADTRRALLHWLTTGLGRNDTEAEPPAPGAEYVSPRVPHFSQGDARWANRLLGSGSTLQRSGCAVACVAMLLRHAGRNVDPAVVDTFLDNNSGYIGDALVWSVAARCAEAGQASLQYGRTLGAPHLLAEALTERVRASKPTMVRVDYAIDGNLEYNHFVVCVGVNADGGFVMNDPAAAAGDGYTNPGRDNVIQTTTRKGGYKIVQLDWFD